MGARARYPGGTFFVGLDADPEAAIAQLASPREQETIWERAQRVLSGLRHSTLLVLDDAGDFAALRRWLPAGGLPVHVLVTTTNRLWPRQEHVIPVGPLTPEDRLKLAEHLLGTTPSVDLMSDLALLADGTTVQFVAAANCAHYELCHGREPLLPRGLAAETVTSFERCFSTLSPDAQELCRLAALFNPSVIPLNQLQDLVGWSSTQFRASLDAACDRGIIQHHTAAVRIHGLFATFLRSVRAGLTSEIVRRHWSAFLRLCAAFSTGPGDAGLRSQLAAYPMQIEFWRELGAPLEASDLKPIGGSLAELGRVAEAKPWFEFAVANAERSPTQAGLGAALHAVGWCERRAGRADSARRWHERAMVAKESEVAFGACDYQSLARTICCLADAHLALGQLEQSRDLCVRALAVLEQAGDRADPFTRTYILATIGECLVAKGEFGPAVPWFERVLLARKQPDARGRIDHERVGRTLHDLGTCHEGLHLLEQAADSYACAVKEKGRGDLHGRVDDESVAKSAKALRSALARLNGYRAAAEPRTAPHEDGLHSSTSQQRASGNHS